MKIVYVITDSIIGGAQLALHQIASRLKCEEFEQRVICLSSRQTVAELFEEQGIGVQCLNIISSFPNPLKFFSLVKAIRESQPDLVQTWMYHADLLGGLACTRAGKPPLVWGIRNTFLFKKVCKQHTILVAKACARLSHRLPDKILLNSNASKEAHSQLGYDAEKMTVIPNGFDVNRFKPDERARKALRDTLNVNDSTALIGFIARFDPIKNHAGFIEAASILSQTDKNLLFVLWGEDITDDNQSLMNLISRAGVEHYFRLMGPSQNIEKIMAGLDLVTSCSFSEAFPNVVGEAMACGVPCVVTDVGDSAMIVGETGVVVPPGDAQALAAGWKHILNLPVEQRREMGQAARKRIVENFSIERTVEAYANLYRQVIMERKTRGTS